MGRVRSVVLAAIWVALVTPGPAAGASTPNPCSLVTQADATAILGVPAHPVSNGSSLTCIYAGRSAARPVLSITLTPGDANAFRAIIGGKERPFVGFTFPGVSLTAFRHDSVRLSRTQAYGESERGNWGSGKREFSYVAVAGPNVIAVSAITQDDPKRAAARGVSIAVEGSNGR